MARKKKSLGEEYGKMVLSRTITTYEKAINGEEGTKPILSQSEYDNIIEQLDNEQEALVYNRYVRLSRWIEHETTVAMGYYYAFQSQMRGYLFAISTHFMAEQYLDEVNSRPLVMTQEEYERLSSEALHKFLNSGNIELGELVYNGITQSFLEYKKHPRRKTKYKEIYDKLKNKKATKKIIAHFNKSYEETIFEAGDTLFNILEYGIATEFCPFAFEIYAIKEEEVKFATEEKTLLRTYYKELLQAVLDDINKELPNHYTINDSYSLGVISRLNAYEKDLLGYQATAKSLALPLYGNFDNGIHIEVHPPSLIEQNRPKLLESFSKRERLSELAKDDNKQSILASQWKETTEAYAILKAYNTAVRAIAKNFGVDDFKRVLVYEDNSLWHGEYLDKYIEAFKEFAEAQSKNPKNKIGQKELNLFETSIKPIKAEKITFSEEKMEEIDNLLSKGMEVLDGRHFPSLDLVNRLLKGVIHGES